MNKLITWLGVLLGLDVVGFTLWHIMGQVPPDSVYIGTITAHVLHLFL